MSAAPALDPLADRPGGDLGPPRPADEAELRRIAADPGAPTVLIAADPDSDLTL